MVDLKAELNKIYMRMDLMPKKMIINMVSKRLINNTELLIRQIGEIRLRVKARDMHQEAVADLLSSMYQLSEMGRCEKLNYKHAKLGLLFGVAEAHQVNTADEGTERATINQAGHFEGTPALHFLLTNVDPLHSVQFSRTYFLTSNSLKIIRVLEVENDAGAVDNYEVKIEKDPLYADEYKLTSVYFNALQAFFKFTSNLHSNCKESTINKVEKHIEKKIINLQEKLTKQEGVQNIEEIVQVKVWAHDILGHRHSLEDLHASAEDFRNYLIVVEVSVKNIRSVVDPSKVIGNICVADSFVFGQK